MRREEVTTIRASLWEVAALWKRELRIDTFFSPNTTASGCNMWLLWIIALLIQWWAHALLAADYLPALLNSISNSCFFGHMKHRKINSVQWKHFWKCRNRGFMNTFPPGKTVVSLVFNALLRHSWPVTKFSLTLKGSCFVLVSCATAESAGEKRENWKSSDLAQRKNALYSFPLVYGKKLN